MSEHELAAQLVAGGLPESTASSLASAAARGILLSDPSVLLDKASRLQQKLDPQGGEGLSHRLLSHSPRLLRSRADTLAANWALLCSTMPASLAARLVTLSPTSLSSARTACASYRTLEEEFGPKAASRAVHRWPRVFIMADMAQRLNLLRQELCSACALSEDQAEQMVRSDQSLVYHRPGSLGGRMAALATAFNAPIARVATALTRSTRLLSHSAQHCVEHLERLHQVLAPRTRQQVADMVLAQPTLLNMEMTRVRRKWQLVTSAAQRYEPWQHQLAEMKPTSVGRLLASRPARLARLLYVAQKCSEASDAYVPPAMTSIVIGTPDKVEELVPGLSDWLARNSELIAEADSGA